MANKKYRELKKDVKKARGSFAGESKILKLKPKREREINSRKISKTKKRISRPRDNRKKIARRSSGARNILTATGVIQGSASRSGAGRPRGTYKYGMPISEYKKLQSQKRALYQQYQEERLNKLRGKGLTNEQIRTLQLQRSLENQPQRQEVQQRVSQIGQVSEKERQVNNLRELIDDELEFRKFTAQNSISPSAQRQLTAIRRIQNKGKADNVEMQRRLQERKIVEKQMNLMKAHENMNKVEMDFTGVDPETNILMAPSVFKEDPRENILKQRRGNILDTASYGNNLFF